MIISFSSNGFASFFVSCFRFAFGCPGFDCCLDSDIRLGFSVKILIDREDFGL